MARHARSLSPQQVIERGFAVVRRLDGVVVRGPEQVQPGDLLELNVARGLIAARVEAPPPTAGLPAQVRPAGTGRAETGQTTVGNQTAAYRERQGRHEHSRGPGASRRERRLSQAAAFNPELCGVRGPLESLTFEELVAALELLTARLSSGEIGIEAAADLYEQAELLHEAAQRRLDAVEARIGRLRPPGAQA